MEQADRKTQPFPSPATAPPPSGGPPPSGPSSRRRCRSPIEEVVDELRFMDVHELADVLRYARRVRAARGDTPTPELVSHVVAAVGRLFPTHRAGVPLSLVRAGLPSVPRALLDKALLEAETRQLLRLEPVKLPAPFVEIGAGIQHERGLLYFALPR